MARRRLQFEPGVAGVEATQPKRLGAGVPEDASSLGWGGDGSQIGRLPDDARTDS